MIVATPILQIKTSPIPITYTVYKPGLLRVVDSQTSSYDISMSSSEIPLREIHLHYMFPRQREYTCFLVRKSWRAEASIYVVYVRMRVVVRFWRAGGSERRLKRPPPARMRRHNMAACSVYVIGVATPDVQRVY